MDQRIDVWLPASKLVKQHGKTGAIAYAAARIIERRGKGLKDQHRWRMIHCAIVELTVRGRIRMKGGAINGVRNGCSEASKSVLSARAIQAAR